ncbi:MAG: penicillin acylase family protein, partial [Marivirga sp.]|nr:penicillin acylase family protein [Marivirga sp.]
MDWFKISFLDKSRNKYLLDNQWVNSKKVVEAFKVRDKAVFYDTVVYTHWGPITYDQNFKAENNLNSYAFRWISHDASDEIVAYYKLNRATNHAEFMEAIDHFSSPAQNFVFASVSGDIAMRVQGKYPQRRPMEGKFVLDGTKSSNGWNAFIPNEQNIQDKNPSRGFVSSANQYPADGTYPFFITGTSFEAYRNRRINKVLKELDKIQPADMMKLQSDNYNLKAEESLPFFLTQLDSSAFTDAEKKARKILSKWDYFNNIDSEGASYYEAWWNNLMPLLWDEMDKEGVLLRRPTTFTTIRLLKEYQDLSLFDIQSTPGKETGREVIQKAFSLGVEDIENWKSKHENSPVQWADFKDSYIGHLMRLEPLGVHVRSGGNRDIVNAHSRTHGPSWRMIVSLEKS